MQIHLLIFFVKRQGEKCFGVYLVISGLTPLKKNYNSPVSKFEHAYVLLSSGEHNLHVLCFARVTASGIVFILTARIFD
jgi:hypothetical protein